MDWLLLSQKAPTNSITKHPTRDTLILDLAVFLGKESVHNSDTSLTEFILRFREYAAQAASEFNASADGVEKKRITAFPDLQYGTVRDNLLPVTALIRALIPASPASKGEEIKPQVAS